MMCGWRPRARLPPAMLFASGRTREARGSCWSGTIPVEGVHGCSKKVFGILRKFARGTHAVYAGSFQTFEPPAPAVGFLYLISQFCIRRPDAVTRPKGAKDLY